MLMYRMCHELTQRYAKQNMMSMVLANERKIRFITRTFLYLCTFTNVVSMLNQFVGKYIENLNCRQLNYTIFRRSGRGSAEFSTSCVSACRHSGQCLWTRAWIDHTLECFVRCVARRHHHGIYERNKHSSDIVESKLAVMRKI